MFYDQRSSSFKWLLLCRCFTTIVITPRRSGTCGLTLVLTRCVVRAREIRLITTIRVEVLSIEKQPFHTRVLALVEGRYVSWSVKFLIAFCHPFFGYPFCFRTRFRNSRRARLIFSIPDSIFVREILRCEINSGELYGLINYTDLRSFPN